MKTTMQAELLSDLENVLIDYPEPFPLNGADRILFDYRLKKMFRDGRVNICTLDSLHDKVFASESDHRGIERDDLQGLHCDRFKEMPMEVLHLLPTLVGTYLGITIHLPMRSSGEGVGAEVSAATDFCISASRIPQPKSIGSRFKVTENWRTLIVLSLFLLVGFLYAAQLVSCR